MNIEIPSELLPREGRFGSGPSRPRIGLPASLGGAEGLVGTSHRQAPVKALVRRIREGLAEFFDAPAGYEVILGNGGASLVWDAIAFTGVRRRAQAAVFGEFTRKAAAAAARAPWTDCSTVEAAAGEVALCDDGAADRGRDGAEAGATGDGAAAEGLAAGLSRTSLPSADGLADTAEPEAVDAYMYAHNETSTGAMSPVRRFGRGQALTFVDATSSAGGVAVDVGETDLYYFSPQKCFGAEGGLWLALASPAALARFEKLAGERYVPDILNLHLAAANSRADQTLNTPSIVNLAILASQIDWMLESGGLAAMDARCRRSSGILYEWAERSDFAAPFVPPQWRSPVVVTIDIDEAIPADALRRVLRANGILDVDPYRSLGRNQLRVATFPNVEADDVEALTACVDYVAERM